MLANGKILRRANKLVNISQPLMTKTRKGHIAEGAFRNLDIAKENPQESTPTKLLNAGDVHA